MTENYDLGKSNSCTWLFLTPDVSSYLVDASWNLLFHLLTADYVTAPDIAKEVDVLQAIRWIKQAWDEVAEKVVQKCFEKYGFSNVAQNNERSEEEEEDQEYAELVR